MQIAAARVPSGESANTGRGSSRIRCLHGVGSLREGGERIECERGWMKGCGDDKVTFDKLISLLKAMNQMNRHPSGHLC